MRYLLRIGLILTPLCLLLSGCGGGTETVNITGVLSDTVEFAGNVSFPTASGITADTRQISSLKGVVKLTDLVVHSPTGAKDAAIDSTGKYVIVDIPRATSYFFHVKDSSGNIYLSAAATLEGALNIDYKSTAEEIAFSEALVLKTSLTLNQFRSKLGDSSALKLLINTFLTDGSISTGTFSIKTDADIVAEAKRLASVTVALID
ncbi:hypothetical protein ACFL35_08935 [Candidatus Riflebacteria bacterium]